MGERISGKKKKIGLGPVCPEGVKSLRNRFHLREEGLRLSERNNIDPKEKSNPS